ncbi:AAA family ATPase [Tsuneonella sp. HG094]
MQRVLVVGPCGAGKSTLSHELARRLDLPLFHMDRLAWKTGWIDSTHDELRAALAPILAGERWLIDGNYGGTLPERLARADTVIVLDYPIPLCLARIVRRYRQYQGRSRPDMTEGCPEKIDFEFVRYVATWRLGPARRLEASLRDWDGRIVRLRNPLETEQWLAASCPAADHRLATS